MCCHCNDGRIMTYWWWRHQMETFSALLAICAGNSLVPGDFPAQRPVTRSFDVFFDLRLNKRLSEQSWGWWFETPLRPLWRHCNAGGWPLSIRPQWPIFTEKGILSLAELPLNKIKLNIYFPWWPLPRKHHKHPCFCVLFPLEFMGVFIHTNIETVGS